MSVGYYSGTSTGPNDLIDKFRIAALAESWTVNDFSSDGTGYRLHLQKSLGGETSYFNLRSAIDEEIFGDAGGATYGKVTGLGINGSTGYDAGEDWDEQPGYTVNSSRSNAASGMVISPMSTSAIPAYYFFFVGNSVHIVVEVTAGEFQMMSFGMISKQGTITGGQYFSASHCSYYNTYRWSNNCSPTYLNICNYTNTYGAGHSGFLYADVDSSAAWRRAASTSYTFDSKPLIFHGAVGGNINPYDNSWLEKSMACPFAIMSPSFYNSMAAMTPVYITILRSDNNHSLVGYPEGVRFLNVTNYDPAEEISYGDETWMVFPSNGITDSDTPTTYYPNGGFAFLKDDGT